MIGLKTINQEYYDVFSDIEKYPEAIIIIAYSRRGVGKTYSALWGCLEKKTKFVYIKRTIDDVELICSSNDEFDTSPFKPINRDKGTNIKPKKIPKLKGIGAFYDDDIDEDVRKPIGYIVALSAVKNIKGIDMSECDYIIFDEFIPQISETRVLHTEGEALLDLYATINRDREKRGISPVKLLLFANAENIYCPVIDELQLIDSLAEIAVSGATYLYLEDRAILIHHINEIAITEEEKGGIYKTMKGTKWFKKSFGGEFSKTDFSNVDKKVLKNYRPLIRLFYREQFFYIYQNGQNYYICKNSTDKYKKSYSLELDNDIRSFYYSYVMDLQEHCMNGHVKFSDYSLYDLIINYSKRFKNVL